MEHLHNHPKIGKTVIYTNGTIIPTKQMLKDLNDGMAMVHISDYGASTEKIAALVKVLKEYPGIEYFVRAYDSWMDLGDTAERAFSVATLKEVYDSCNQRSCKHFHNDRFYSCPRVASLYRMGLCGNEREWVDFASADIKPEDYRQCVKELLTNKVPYEACLRCNGSLYSKSIPAAEQLK